MYKFFVKNYLRVNDLVLRVCRCSLDCIMLSAHAFFGFCCLLNLYISILYVYWIFGSGFYF